MRIDWDSPAIITYRNLVVLAEVHFNAAGVSGDGLVHGIVEDFGNQMVQGFFVGATDIHAGPTAHGLKAFKDFDVLGGIFRFLGTGLLEKV